MYLQLNTTRWHHNPPKNIYIYIPNPGTALAAQPNLNQTIDRTLVVVMGSWVYAMDQTEKSILFYERTYIIFFSSSFWLSCTHACVESCRIKTNGTKASEQKHR